MDSKTECSEACPCLTAEEIKRHRIAAEHELCPSCATPLILLQGIVSDPAKTCNICRPYLEAHLAKQKHCPECAHILLNDICSNCHCLCGKDALTYCLPQESLCPCRFCAPAREAQEREIQQMEAQEEARFVAQQQRTMEKLNAEVDEEDSTLWDSVSVNPTR